MVFEYINDETFFLHKRILKIFGLWPKDRWRIGPLIILAISSTLKIVAAISTMIMFDHGLLSGGASLSFSLWMLAQFLSAVAIRINSDSIVRLIVSTVDDWSVVTNPKEREIMKCHQYFGRSFYVVSIFVCVEPIVRRILYFPFFVNATLTVQQQTALNDHYTWLAVYSVLFTAHHVYVIFELYGILMLFHSLTMHLSGQFKILRANFQKFLRTKNKNKSRILFRRLVDRHNRLLDLSNDLRNSFSVTLAVAVLGTQGWACLESYRLALAILNCSLVETATAIIAIVYSLWSLFVVYNAGEYLVTCSNEIGEVFQQCKWYNLSKDSRINISIVVLRSRMSKTLTTAGLYKLNHSNYKYAVKAMYSYVSLILAITKN